MTANDKRTNPPIIHVIDECRTYTLDMLQPVKIIKNMTIHGLNMHDKPDHFVLKNVHIKYKQLLAWPMQPWLIVLYTVQLHIYILWSQMI